MGVDWTHKNIRKMLIEQNYKDQTQWNMKGLYISVLLYSVVLASEHFSC